MILGYHFVQGVVGTLNDPSITSCRETAGGAGAHVVLTIRGITVPVVIESAYLGVVTDPFGNDKAIFSGCTELDREAFGMTWNVALESSGALVGPKLKVELEVQATRI